MHEYRVAVRIVERAEEAAQRQGARRVSRVTVTVGEDEHIEPEALAFSLTAAAQGTLLEQAQMDVESQPGSEIVLQTIEVE